MTHENRETRREVSRTLRRIHKLQISRHDRDAQQVFFVEGVRNFVAAVDNEYGIDTVVYSDRLRPVDVRGAAVDAPGDLTRERPPG